MMAAECDVQSELEVLQSIYLDELHVDRTEEGNWEVSLVLYPSTAEDSVSQFVRLTLTLTLDQQYPSASPVVSVRNPRGLSDDKLSSVQRCLHVEAQSCLGSPMLYQLIEKAKEMLTDSNIPHGNCVICLYGFKEGETFTKTSCYHYFHSHCLGRYVRHSESELRQWEKELQEDKTRDGTKCQELTVVCPVCRETLTYNVQQLLSSPEPQLPEVDRAATGSDFQLRWKELQKLLEKQRSRGGIIDPEEESNRFLIHTSQAPAAPEDGHLQADVSPGPPSSCNEAAVAAARQSHCRAAQGQRRPQQARGPRRGGRSRPQHGRPPPITDHLDKLSLTSKSAEEAQDDNGGDIKADLEACQTRTDREMSADLQETHVPADPKDAAAQQETHVSADQQETHVSAAQQETHVSADLQETHVSADLQASYQEAGHPKDAAGTRGHRGRRRGPHHPAQHSGPTGPARHHWDGRPSRSRGGAHLCGGRPRRGHGGRGFQQKVVERGREEVL